MRMTILVTLAALAASSLGAAMSQPGPTPVELVEIQTH
jgi:hypothetical protein